MNPLNPLANIAQKAFYLGMGLASLATEKANATLTELRSQGSKLAEELVERGEMSAEEAKKFVDDLIVQAQQGKGGEESSRETTEKLRDASPRTIDIDDANDLPKEDEKLEELKAKVRSLQNELKNIQN
jgi:polyhydroxyalkanoate synthesis regulator phasin